MRGEQTLKEDGRNAWKKRKITSGYFTVVHITLEIDPEEETPGRDRK